MKVVEIRDNTEHGLAHRYVFGLNLLLRNDQHIATPQDPRIVFLRAVSDQLPCSAHVGSLALSSLVDAPEAFFGPPTKGMTYIRTRVDYYGQFYEIKGSKPFDACFFPHVVPLFWEAHSAQAPEDDLAYLLLDHGLALYVGATPSSVDIVQGLLQRPFPGHGAWLQDVTRLYPVLMTMGHDGDFFEVFTQDAEHFSLLTPALACAEEAIRTNPWFREHQAELEWDMEFDMSLKLRG